MEASTAREGTSRRLTPAEAETLWRAWHSRGDVAARDRLVLAYAPMTRYLAVRKARALPAHCDVDDLVSCGMLALIGAADRFDPARGASFEQYAWTRVSGAIVDELRGQDWASRSVRRFGRELERARDRLTIRHGESPTRAALAAELGVGDDELCRSLSHLERAAVISLNAPARSAENGLVEVGETVPADGTEYDPEHALASSDRSAAVRKAVAGLTEREQLILKLLHVDDLPGAEVGRRLGVSESRISQILSGIRSKLRTRLAAYEAA